MTEHQQLLALDAAIEALDNKDIILMLTKAKTILSFISRRVMETLHLINI